MKVSVIGLEQVGRASAASLIRLGHRLTGVDLRSAQAEPAGAEDCRTTDTELLRLIDATSSESSFHTTADLQSAVLDTEVTLVCLTPSSNANGSQDLWPLDKAFIQIGAALAKKSDYHLIIVRSAVLPGTVEGRFTLLLEQHSGRQAGDDFGVCMNPVSSRGLCQETDSARIVIGELDSRSGDAAQQLYNGLKLPIIRTTIQTAEMLNYVSSAFHAVKITFANEIGNLCTSHGIDGQVLMEHFCLDRDLNLSSAYLKPGFAFGGPRLPRDLRALVQRAKEQDVDCPLISAVLPSNQRQISRAVELVEKTRRSKIAILGLGFQSATEGLVDNPVVHLAQMLAGKGYSVRIFDENAEIAALKETNTSIQDLCFGNLTRLFESSLQEIIRESEVVVVASRHEAVRNIPSMLSDKQILIDLAGAARESTSAATKYATS